MTAATAYLVRSPGRASLRGATARVLAVVALVLPVPFCAVLGLSLPLPASVARIAAKIVPFSNSAALDANEDHVLGARGSIVLVAGEPAADDGGSAIDPSLAVDRPRSAGGVPAPGGKIGGTTRPSPIDTATTVTTPATAAQEYGSTPRRHDPGSSISETAAPVASTPSPGTEPPPPSGGGGPAPPSVTPTVVDSATAAAATVVGTVSNTATTATATLTDTADAAAATAGGIVTGVTAPLLPKKP
jgi:hypothetical protein